MDLLELEMLMELCDRIGFVKASVLCALLLVLRTVRARCRSRRRKRIYREFKRELVLCRQRLDSIHKHMQVRPSPADRNPSFITICLIDLWRKIRHRF